MFDALKVAAPKQGDTHKVYADATVVGEGEDAALVLRLSLKDLAQSKASKNGEGAVGFMFQPVTFDVKVGEATTTLAINPGFTSLKRIR